MASSTSVTDRLSQDFQEGARRTLPEQEMPFSPITNERVTRIHVHTYRSKVADNFIIAAEIHIEKINTVDAHVCTRKEGS